MQRERWERPVPTQIHGRYLVDGPSQSNGASHPWLVGFHGYGENAEQNLQQMRRISGAERCLICAIQSLHLFYNTKSREVVGSWMTRQQRLLAIEDNVAYVRSALEGLREQFGAPQSLVLLGFSQGAAMAYRAAARCISSIDGLIILAGDVPPDVADTASGKLPPILLGRGHEDPWYTEEKLQADLDTLKRLDTPVEVCRFPGGHGWSAPFRQAAARFLENR